MPRYNTLKWKTCLIIVFLGFLIAGNVSADVTDQLVELTKKIEELTKSEAQLKKNINQKSKEAQSLSKDIGILRAQILRLQTSIEITKNQIEVTGLEIQRVRQEIFDTEDILVRKKRSIKNLIRELNDIDNKSFAAIILNSGTLSDFFSEVEYVNGVSSSILATLQELRGVKEELLEKEGILSEKKIESERLSVQYQSRQSALSGSKVSKANLLDRTKGQEAEYIKLLSEVERQKAEFFGELRSLEEAARNEGIFIVEVKSAIPPKGKIFSWPEDDPILTQSYGYTTYARRGAYGGAPHNGIDMASGAGTFIKSIGDGKLIAKGFNNGFGNWAAIQHTNGLVSLYAHMRSPSFLVADEVVKKGDIVGHEGSTGNSTGSHLHLSLYNEFFTYINSKRNNQVYFNYFDGTINPLNYM